MKRHNYKSVIVTLLVLIFILGGFAVFDIKNISEQNKQTSELLNKSNEIADDKIQIQNIHLLQTTEKVNIARLEDYILTSDRLVLAIEKIEQAGRDLDLETKTVSVDESVEVEVNPHTIILDVETEGSWNNNMLFLHALENLPYRMDIEEARFNKTTELWSGKFKVILYTFKN